MESLLPRARLTRLHHFIFFLNSTLMTLHYTKVTYKRLLTKSYLQKVSYKKLLTEGYLQNHFELAWSPSHNVA